MPAMKRSFLDRVLPWWYWRRHADRKARAGIPRIILVNSTVAEDAEISTEIGVFKVLAGSGDYTFALETDADSKFAVAGDGTLTTIDTLDYSVSPAHQIEVSADNGVEDPITRWFTIIVTEAP